MDQYSGFGDYYHGIRDHYLGIEYQYLGILQTDNRLQLHRRGQIEGRQGIVKIGKEIYKKIKLFVFKNMRTYWLVLLQGVLTWHDGCNQVRHLFDKAGSTNTH